MSFVVWTPGAMKTGTTINLSTSFLLSKTSIASGMLAGINAANKMLEKEKLVFNEYTMLGAISKYISTENKNFHQWMQTLEYCQN